MKTSEEFLLEATNSKNIDKALNALNNGEFTIELMIKFAKYHVECALKSASDNAGVEQHFELNYEYSYEVDKDSILNSYPLENIK